MTIYQTFRLVLAAALISISVLSLAQKQATCSFSYFAIDDSTTPNAVNDNLVIVGLSHQKGYTRQPNGHHSTYLVPGSTFTSFNGINDSNIKVGVYTPSGTTATTGLALHGSTIASVHHPGDTWGTSLTGINKAGKIVGWYLDNNEVSHGFTIKNGVFSPVEFPNAFWTAALAINDNGVVVGYYTFSDGTNHAFIDRAGTFTSYDFPGSLATSFNGISAQGVVIGSTRLPQNELWTPFLFKNGVYKIITAPHAQFTNVNGINQNGIVTGNAYFSSGWKGFTATCR